MSTSAGHVLFVEQVHDLTPGMRRVHFAGPAVRAYMAAVPYIPNIKLLFPDPAAPIDAVPPLSRRTADGVAWQDGQRARVRTYSVRAADPVAGTLVVDFVRHGPAGLASGWAERAVPGAAIIALGGGGLVAEPGEWVLLVGDETALPAIAATLERFGPHQPGLALIEVADAAERQELTVPAGFTVRWLLRDGAPAGSTTLLQDALAGVDFPAAAWAAGTVRIWVSAESAVVRFARRHLRERGFNRAGQLIIGYWHRGLSEPGYAGAADHDRVVGELVHELAGQELARFHDAH